MQACNAVNLKGVAFKMLLGQIPQCSNKQLHGTCSQGHVPPSMHACVRWCLEPNVIAPLKNLEQCLSCNSILSILDKTFPIQRLPCLPEGYIKHNCFSLW